MDKTIEIKLGSISFKLGEEIVELENNVLLKDDRRSQMFLRTMGFGQYKRTNKTLGELSEVAIKETIEKSNLTASDIDLVIYASSTFGDRHGDDIDKDVASCLINCGLEQVYPIGIYLSQCNNFFAALDMAVSKLAQSNVNNIILVLADRVLDESTRFKNLAINSDAAVACIISSDNKYQSNYVLKGHSIKTHLTNKDMIDPVSKEFDLEIHSRYLNGIDCVSKETQAISGIELEQCQQLICHNFSFSALKQISNAVSYDYENVFKGNISEFGHAYTCDSLINLETYRAQVSDNESTTPSFVSVLSTGLYFWGMAIMEITNNEKQ